VDTVFQKKIVRSANARYAAEGACKMLVAPAHEDTLTLETPIWRAPGGRGLANFWS
jgi:hypothetical protein